MPPAVVAREFSGGHRRGLLVRLRTSRWAGVLWRLLPALLPSVLLLPAVLAPPFNHDVAAVLQFSQRWLAGEHLYTDLIDVNPPLIFVLNLVPAAIAEVTPLDAIQALQLCLFAFGLACWWLAIRVRSRADEGPIERALLDVLPLLFLLGAGSDFGQREHLMAMAALPYILLAERRALGSAAGTVVTLAVAVIAGIAFALKPHFLGVPALVEFAVLAGRSRGGWHSAFRATLRDPLLWAIGGVWAAYLLSLPLVFPDYLGSVVPLVWDFYLDIGGLSVWQVMLVPRMATVLVALVPLLWLSFSRPLLPTTAAAPSGLRAGLLPRLLAVAALGGVASAAAQHKGWSYHILPMALFTGALAAVSIAAWLDRVGVASPAPSRIAGGLIAVLMLFVISNSEAPWKELTYSGSPGDMLTTVLNQEAAGERVLVLSPAIYPIFPALNYAHVRATLRTMNMWLLEGAYQQCLPDGRTYRDVWEMGRAEFFVFRTVAEDFAHAPPAAVVVDRQPGIPWCGAEFDFIAYFRRHPLFAEVWSHYQLTAEWDRYRVYTRKD